MSVTGINLEAGNTATIATPKRAAVIDDAFDDVTPGEVTFIQCQEFYELANESGELDTLLRQLNIDPPRFTDWPSQSDNSDELSAFLKSLWSNRENAGLLKLMKGTQLFSVKLAKLADLDRVCKNLEAHEIEVKKFSSQIDDLAIFEQQEFLYIFIDYNLGVQDGEDAIKNAKAVAKSIYDKCPKDRQRPVTVLMSAKPVTEGDRQKFQREATMLEGVFRFSSKDDLINENKVSLLVRAYREEFQSNHALQDYIHALISAAKKAQAEFEEDIKILRVEDYEYIHHSVLRNQKQPLGDYLAWLYGIHWSNLLIKNDELKDKQKVIDSVLSNKPPVHHSPPSEKIAEMFMNALFEQNLDAISSHPMEIKTDGSSDEKKPEENVDKKVSLPFLHLGDVFSKVDEKRVFMILNPQCDLERPDQSMLHRSIFVITGQLVSIDETLKGKPVKTEFFVFQDAHYRIEWNLKNVETISFGEFETWMSGRGFERKHRLRLPYALDVQHRFTTDISRVGLPVSPPLTKYIALTVQYKDVDDKVVDLIGHDKNDGYCFVPMIQNPDKEIRFTLKFALDFKGAIIDQLNLLDEKRASMDSVPKALNKRIEKMKSFIEGFDEWFFEKNNNLKVPKENETKPLLNDVLSIGLNLDTYIAQTLFLINLRTKPKEAYVIQTSSEDGAEEQSEVIG